ncbi:hypothetical protein DSECCO2_462130 [anaerobic digester metagenome]
MKGVDRAVPIALACLALLAAGCTTLLGPAVEYPAIAPAPGVGDSLYAKETFRFETVTVTVGCPVDAAVYRGAKRTPKEVLLRGPVPEEEWIAGHYLAQVDDPAQDRFWADLLGAFRAEKDRLGLDDDRYLELLTAAVQQLPYETAPETASRFPVETWIDQAGDCDDRSLLLAGLLAHEGYRVALLVFLPEAHMAIGVGCAPEHAYNGTGYAYLEATNTSFIGVAPTGLDRGERLESAPIVIPVGDGKKEYGAIQETVAIERAVRVARAQADELGHQIDRRRAALDQDRERLEALQTAGDQEAFASGLDRYRADSAAVARLVEEHNRQVELVNYCASHGFDRVGTAAYISARLP